VKLAGPFRLALLAVWMAIPGGCATIASKLPAVISAVTDGMMVLDTIEAFIRNYFTKHPAPETQARVDVAIARTRGALSAALRTAHGAEKLDQAQIDAAFADFKAAYQDLMVLLTPLGVRSGDRLAAAPNSSGLIVPEPLAFGLGAAREGGSRPAAPAAKW
jgi:hypothetical protein